VFFFVVNLYNKFSQGEIVAYFILKELFSRFEIYDFLIITKDNTEKIIKSKTYDDLIEDLTYTGVKTDVYKSGKDREKTFLVLA
jgi:hypothetical protein